MRSKSDIISELATSQEVGKACTRITGGHELADDLKQEMLLTLMNYEDSFIEGLDQRGELMYFVARILLNMWRSDRSTFYRQYRQPHNEFDTNSIIVSDTYDTALDMAAQDVKKILEEMKSKREDWYEAQVFELVLKHGSQIKVSKLTGIHRTNINKAYNRARNYIADKIKNKQ